MTDAEREAAEIEQARLERLKKESQKKIDRIRKRQSVKSLEREQERERKNLTRDSREKNNRNVSSKRSRGKQAPGRKRTKKPLVVNRKLKSKKAKEAVEVRRWREATHNDIVRMLKQPDGMVNGDGSPHAQARAKFVQYLGERMVDSDITPANWLDWLEGEVDRFRSTLRSERLITDE